MAWHEFPEGAAIQESTFTKLNGYLIKEENYEEKFAWLRDQTLTVEEIEVIRRHRQISFAVLGFDAKVYPCITEKPFDPNVMSYDTSTSSAGTLKNLDLLKPMKVERWDNPHANEAVARSDLSPLDAAMLANFHSLLRVSNDPASFHKTATARKLTKIMCTPTYLDVFSEEVEERRQRASTAAAPTAKEKGKGKKSFRDFDATVPEQDELQPEFRMYGI